MLSTESHYCPPLGPVLAGLLPAKGHRSQRIVIRLAMLFVLLALPIPGFAQTTVSTGGIQGTVTDPSGALVSGAKVSVANVATGETTSAKTNSAGAYTF